MEKITSFTLEGSICGVKVENIPQLSIFKTFDCGQSFRFNPVSIFGNKHEFGGVAFGRYVVFAQNHDREIIIYNATKEDYASLWREFLSLDVDYSAIDSKISRTLKSEHMDKAIEYSKGIRILRQDSWEAICSFIISQNNNIPRIKKIISAMSEKYGKAIDFLGEKHYSFPEAQELLNAGEQGIFALKTGFRAKYIIDACQALCDGRVSVDRIKKEGSFESCVAELCTVKGIGLKVACCALLFGFGRTEAFPVDVWMRRALENHFPSGIDLASLGDTAGIAQQYLFYYEKYAQNT